MIKTNNHWSDWWEIWIKVISLNCAWKLGGFETSGGVYDWGSPRNDIYIQLKTFYCRGNTMAALNMFTGNFLSHQEGTTILYHTEVIWRSTRWMVLQAAWLWYCNPGAQKRLFGFLMVRLGKDCGPVHEVTIFWRETKEIFCQSLFLNKYIYDLISEHIAISLMCFLPRQI